MEESLKLSQMADQIIVTFFFITGFAGALFILGESFRIVFKWIQSIRKAIRNRKIETKE